MISSISPAPAGISTKNIRHIIRKTKQIFLQSRNRIINLLKIVRRVQATPGLNCSKRAEIIKTNVHN